MPDSNGLFPLKLVAFEHYMLVDDHADYPMVIRLELEFDGDLDRDRFAQALDLTQEENPLLRARVEEISGELCWVEGDKCGIDWTDELPEFQRLNLREHPGLKVYASQQDDGFSIRLFIHHSVADGAGINRFVERWLAHYQSLAQRNADDTANDNGDAGASVAKINFDPELNRKNLEQRGWFGMNFFKYLLRPFQEFCGMIGVIDYFMHRPVAIGPQKTELSETPSESEPLSLQFFSATLTKEESKQILTNAKQLGYKVNDVMLTAMYEAFYHWLAEHQPDEADRYIRIMIPMDMRSKKNPEQFVGNKVSMIFVDRRPGRCRSLKHLCWWVWIEMAACKAMKLGLTFFHLIRFYRSRNKLHKLLRRDRSIASTVLSNMGPILNRTAMTDSDNGITADGIRLKEYKVYPPIRAYTWLTAVIVTYRNQVSIHGTWCNKSLTPEDVSQITERFKTNLLEGFIPGEK